MSDQTLDTLPALISSCQLTDRTAATTAATSPHPITIEAERKLAALRKRWAEASQRHRDRKRAANMEHLHRALALSEVPEDEQTRLSTVYDQTLTELRVQREHMQTENGRLRTARPLKRARQLERKEREILEVERELQQLGAERDTLALLTPPSHYGHQSSSYVVTTDDARPV